MKFDKNAIFEENSNPEILKSYLNHEKKYLECVYLQILRNSESENFTKSALFNFLNCSDYLIERIFKIMKMNKSENKSISLKEFTNCITNIFSRVFWEAEGLKRIELIFNLISYSNDSLNFKELIIFVNQLLFEAFCKAKLANYTNLILTCKNLKNYLKNFFLLQDSGFDKKTKIPKADFCKILENNPSLINLFFYLLNLISPLNENLLAKICKSQCSFYSNDDFESEFDLNETTEMNQINSLYINQENEKF